MRCRVGVTCGLYQSTLLVTRPVRIYGLPFARFKCGRKYAEHVLASIEFDLREDFAEIVAPERLV